jgi:hypothetical protein
MPVRLFVGNLPYDATEEDIRAHFATAGNVLNVFVPLDRETGRKRGFAFVEFNNNTEAQEAIRLFNSQPFKGVPWPSTKPVRRKAGRPLLEGAVDSVPGRARRLQEVSALPDPAGLHPHAISIARIPVLSTRESINTPASLVPMPSRSRTEIRRHFARKAAKRHSKRG